VNFQDDLQHKKNEENIQEVQKVVHSYCCLIICEVAEESGISKTTCHEILTENLGIYHVAAKFVPHLLGEEIVLMSLKILSTVQMLMINF
jgi:DNA invertase Pin-like site-specific DNA recombinase